MSLGRYETDRLVLETPRPELARGMRDYYVRNREFLRPYDPARDEDFFTLDRMQRDAAADMDAIARGAGFRLWIRKKGDPEERLIGTLALSNIVRGAFLSCYLGYKLDAGELRKGYMSEAARKLIEIAFAELGLHRIEANIMPQNRASLGLARKLGFEMEGMSPKYLRIDGVWEDHARMALRNPNME